MSYIYKNIHCIETYGTDNKIFYDFVGLYLSEFDMRPYNGHIQCHTPC